MERPWSNDLGVLWIPSEPEKPARRRLAASRSVDFALASRPAAVMLVAAVLAQSAAVPVSAIAQGKDPVGWLPSEDGGTASGEDNVPDGQLGEEDQPDASTDAPAPAPPPPTPEPVQTPAPTPEPVATPEAVATPAATPEAVATPEPTPTAAVAEAPPAPVPAEPAATEAPLEAEPAVAEAPPAPAPAVTEAPPAPAPTEPAAATPVITPAATATPELRETRRAEPKQPIRRTPARPAQPAPPPPPVPSASAPVAAPAAQPASAAIPRGADHYEVQPGDSLWRIAERLLGPRASVRSVAALTAALWEHNRGRIGSPSPDVLPAGITILIP